MRSSLFRLIAAVVLCSAAGARAEGLEQAPLAAFTPEYQLDTWTMGHVELGEEIDPVARAPIHWQAALIPGPNGSLWLAVHRQWHQTQDDGAAACAFNVQWGPSVAQMSLPVGPEHHPSLQAAIRFAPFVYNAPNPSLWTQWGLYPDPAQFNGLTVCVARVQ